MPRARILRRDVDKLLVEERKKMRVQFQESKFTKRTHTIYKHQLVRAKELGKLVLYTLDELRAFMREKLEEGKCYYCSCRLTLSILAGDHKDPVSRGGLFTIPNLAVCCKPCNFQKGTMNESEFIRLNAFLETLPADVAKNVKARLSSGGKWIGRG